MKDYLLDIVQHTYGLGMIDMIKIVGDQQSTVITAISEDKQVILEGKSKAPIAEFVGTFGMPNLGKLNTILNIPEYKEATITVVDKGGAPGGLHFENKAGDFKNDYRFMSDAIVNEKIKNVKFKGAKWNVDIKPTALSIQRLKFQASANNEAVAFVAKTEKSQLKFYFGDAANHAGDFVFEQGVTGTLAKGWAWPIGVYNSILSLPGDKTMKISDEGVSLITVDSGLIEYNYFIPAMTK
jgi:hypothetical protein